MYTEHIVAFIDILGFREIVMQSGFEEVNKIYDEFKGSVDDGVKRSLFLLQRRPDKEIELDLNKVKVLVFSDCIVWCYPTDGLKQPEYFMIMMALKGFFFQIQNRVFHQGVPIRGGISIGNLFIQENKVFGAGLVKAYELEHYKAIYPRIILD